ncbi:MAG TPA: carboxypeptidase regulatory-like domain-containing protein, partial [Bryobacteraceae bacterium]|nr:carboxypeptidase regulatory-like domain-containing protein [Bryobacteraceae bacterium]
ATFATHFMGGLSLLALAASIASGQSTISGVVKDSTGAIIANATVEASSDVLIERTRTVTTDSLGRYAIIDLRPGSYVVTVTQSGFAAMKQTVVVPANVTVPVDAELKPGTVAETVNVEAIPATVDVENVAHPETLTRAEMDVLPTGRYMQSIASYVPGAHLNLPDIGGSQQIEQNYITLHGASATANVYMFDGMLVNTTYNDGAIQQYIDNEAIQETTHQNTQINAEASGGGMFLNLVPKDGGNRYHFQFFGGGSGGSNFWQGNNLDSTLAARGLAGQDKTVKIEDFDGSFGGPIKKDKLWFLMTGRKQLTYTQAGASQYPDGKAGIQDGYIYAGSMRLTYQATPRNKFSAFWLRNWKYKGHEILDGGQEGYLPADPSVAATQRNKWPMYYILQTKWTGTLSPKLIASAGMSISHLDYNDLYVNPATAQPAFTPSWYALTTARDQGTLRRYFAPRSNQQFQSSRNFFTASGAYVTGSHQIKFGFQDSFGPFRTSVYENGDGYMLFTNGLPTSFTAINTPYYRWPRLDADLGLYAEDTWHYKRLAISAGIRWEYLAASIDAENAPGGRFVGARNVPHADCSTIKGMGCWHDWAPRAGVIYDLFGNHRTALKAGFAKYNSQYATGFTDNLNPMAPQTQSIAWSLPGGVTAPGGPCAPVTFAGLAAPNPNCFPTGSFGGSGALAGVGAGTLGASPNPSFGSIVANNGVNLDPNWHRDYVYAYSAGVQQEIYRGVTLNFNWYRGSHYQSTLLLNYAVPSSAWTQTTIINPLDGSSIPFFYLPKAAPAPVVWQTNAPQSLVRNTYTGYETSVQARLPRGMFVFAGWTISRDLDRNCAMSAVTAGTAMAISGTRLNDPNSLRFCDYFGELNQDMGAFPSPPWQNEFKLQGAVPIRWGFTFSTSFYSNRYGEGLATGGTVDNGYLGRTWTVTAATTYPKNCVGCTPGAPLFPAGTVLGQGSETVQLVAPGKVLAPRLNQLDFSLKKKFTFGERFVLEPEAQVFNVLNSNAAVIEAVSLGSDAAPYLPKSACTSSSPANCGLGGTVNTITNPRLLRLAVLFRF